jgi:Flp pilus assembly protein TadB
VALYAVIGLLGFAGLLFGLVQWWLGTTPVALWSVPAALVLGGAVYALALAGQRLSQAQIVQLRAFLDDAVGANRA